jgi:predicted NAD/FAD-dependent oxidoreductase
MLVERPPTKTSAACVAVVGAGVAGAACARWLADAGLDVRLFDKSRGVGGRLATRRAEAAGADGAVRHWRFDHGAPGFGASAPEFVRFVEQGVRDGLLARWQPRVAPGGYAPLDDPVLWVPTPDMPALCRALAAGVPLHSGGTVDALLRAPAGWSLHSAGSTLGGGFDAVIVATPLPQAAPLLRPHRADWEQRAQALPMLPTWTLMAVTDDPDPARGWDLAWPAGGALGTVVRDDAKPGRERVPELARWVVHATAAWSETHLEAAPGDVQAALKQALAAWLGRPLAWHHAAVHRWRHGSVPRAAAAAAAGRCWWDPALGLGVCGDALGGAGVEGAWSSARALAALVIDRGPGSQAPRAAASSAFAPATRSR